MSDAQPEPANPPAPVFQQPAGGVLMDAEKVENVPFGAMHEGKFYDFNPTKDEIQRAVAQGQLEARGIQSHRDELDREWLAKSGGNPDAIAKLQREYNARRIAHFVVHGWPDALRVERSGKMHDGTHRLRAALHLEQKLVAVEYVD